MVNQPEEAEYNEGVKKLITAFINFLNFNDINLKDVKVYLV